MEEEPVIATDEQAQASTSRTPALLRRFPRFGYRPPERPILASGAGAEMGSLAGDLAVLEEQLVPHFRALDREALRAQNGFRLAQTLLIGGGLLATVLGAVQAVGDDLVWPGLAEAGVLVVLGAVLYVARELRFQQVYIDSRLRAERLREEFFLYLARSGEYDVGADGELERVLRRRVHEIRSESRS